MIKGRWKYLEHDWTAEEGSFVYEPPGEIHTLTVPDDCAEMITFFNISGAMIYLDAEGRQIGYEDVFTQDRHVPRALRGTRASAPTTSSSSSAERARARRSSPGSASSPVGGGAAIGAWLRWELGTLAQSARRNFPLGTLASNLIGGYLVGLAVAYFGARHDLLRRSGGCS